MAQQRVLVVEDDPFIRDTVKEVLEDEGFAVTTAGDGFQALAALGSAAVLPSLILLDLMMPVMNGWELLTRLKEDHSYRSIPVVVASASGQAPSSADRALRKPYGINELLRVMGELCPS